MDWPKRTAGQKPETESKSMHSKEFAGLAEGHFQHQTRRLEAPQVLKANNPNIQMKSAWWKSQANTITCRFKCKHLWAIKPIN